MKKILLMALSAVALTITTPSANARTADEAKKDSLVCTRAPHCGPHFEGHHFHQPCPGMPHHCQAAMRGHEFRPADPQTMAVRKALRLKEELLLSDKQYDEVYKVYYSEFKEMESKRADGSQAESEKRFAAIEKSMKKILNDEQFRRWNEREHAKQGHRQCPPARQ